MSNYVARHRHPVRVVAILLIMLAAAVACSAQVRFRLATLVPKGTSYHHYLQSMGEEWRKAPNGGVQLTLYTDGVMGGEADMVRRMRNGQLQAAMLTVPGLAEIDPSVSALQKMPMMYQSLDEARYVREHLRPILEKRILDKGFVVLFWGDAGWVHFFTKRPGIHVADFRTMKMFVASGDPAQMEVMNAAGFHPVAMEYTDTYVGLETGMIDAVPTLPFYALSGQFDALTPHMLDLKWVPLVGAIVVTRKAWEALPEDTRRALLVSAQKTGGAIQERSVQEGEESVAAMKKRGLQVHPVSPELDAEWRRAAEDYYPRIRGSVVPADVFDEARRLVQEYRTQQNAHAKVVKP